MLSSSLRPPRLMFEWLGGHCQGGLELGPKTFCLVKEGAFKFGRLGHSPNGGLKLEEVLNLGEALHSGRFGLPLSHQGAGQQSVLPTHGAKEKKLSEFFIP